MVTNTRPHEESPHTDDWIESSKLSTVLDDLFANFAPDQLVDENAAA